MKEEKRRRMRRRKKRRKTRRRSRREKTRMWGGGNTCTINDVLIFLFTSTDQFRALDIRHPKKALKNGKSSTNGSIRFYQFRFVNLPILPISHEEYIIL